MSKQKLSSVLGTTGLSRRRFVQGLAAGGAALSMPSVLNTAWAKEKQLATTATGMAPVLRGTDFHLVIDETMVNYTGKPCVATTINGSIPAPILRWREGDTITIRVTNKMKVSTSIHWHGIILPYQMDGVPGVSFNGIPAGETFTYQFKVEQSGTYWYHSHTGFQEQTGMYGAIIVDPAKGDRHRVDRDYVVQLSDWTDEDPMDVFAKLKKMSDYYNFSQPTVSDFFSDVSDKGLDSALSKRRMWNEMRMNPTDLADISAYTYTFLMNGTNPASNWTGLFKPGEKIRLRFVDSGTQSFFDVRIPGLKMTVIHVDGQDIEPVTVDEFRFGPGETYDVIVEPKDQPYTIFAQAMDRTGFARGTLAPKAGMQAEVPALDKIEWLTMRDMMGNMAGDNSMQGMAGMAGMGHNMSANAPKNAVHVRHASTEYGPSVDMRVNMPRTNLDDPGVGLRNNGRRVLTYDDIRSIDKTPDPRDGGRDIELHLTGNMERYTWSLDGLEFGKSTPVRFRHNERLRVILHNDTMMTHPMHMHGMWSDQTDENGNFMARRHTISVQPAQRVTFLVTADALGSWAWHCHLLYHMDAGMFRQIVVA